jgi:hypothetical protein
MQELISSQDLTGVIWLPWSVEVEFGREWPVWHFGGCMLVPSMFAHRKSMYSEWPGRGKTSGQMPRVWSGYLFRKFLLRSSFGEAAGRPRSTRALLLAGTTDAFPPVRVTIAFAKGRGEAAPYQWLLHFELCNSAVATPVGALYKWLDITSQWRRDA